MSRYVTDEMRIGEPQRLVNDSTTRYQRSSRNNTSSTETPENPALFTRLRSVRCIEFLVAAHNQPVRQNDHRRVSVFGEFQAIYTNFTRFSRTMFALTVVDVDSCDPGPFLKKNIIIIIKSSPKHRKLFEKVSCFEQLIARLPS